MKKIVYRVKVFLCIIGFIALAVLSRTKNKIENNMEEELPDAVILIDEIDKDINIHKQKIRVLIKNTDYQSIYHEQVLLSSDTDYTLSFNNGEQEQFCRYKAGEEVLIKPDCDFFYGHKVVVTPQVQTGKIILKNVHRNQGCPAYSGCIERFEDVGGIIAINEVDLEEYLYSVVPSEMPSSYPKEALCAQAVCARTYAYRHILQASYPRYEAHVDDSTSFQVYNNIPEQESTTDAVNETRGLLLYAPDGEPAATFYYSASCGFGSDETVWKTNETMNGNYLHSKRLCNSDAIDGKLMMDEEAFQTYIMQVNENDFEKDCGWYRWNYRVEHLNMQHIYDILCERYNENETLVLTKKEKNYISEIPQKFKCLKDIYIAARGPGGVADELVIETDNNTYKIISEHNIRYVLNSGENQVKLQDGKLIECKELLPSGFFILQTRKEKENVVGYSLIGGGFGHGAGMSQNCAKQMAVEGYSYEQILQFFFENCTIEQCK